MTRTMLTPGCCDAVKEHNTVFLCCDSGDIYGHKEGAEEPKPKWMCRSWNNEFRCNDHTEVKFCPHCAKSVPEIEPSNITDRKICSVTDGGYYCDSCSERLHACTCLPHEYRWKIVGVELVIPPEVVREDDDDEYEEDEEDEEDDETEE